MHIESNAYTYPDKEHQIGFLSEMYAAQSWYGNELECYKRQREYDA